RLGGDPSVVGRSIALNGVPFTIVGVTPPEFFGVDVGVAPDVTVPLVMLPRLQEANPALGSVRYYWLDVMGRMKPGMSQQQAQAELTSLYQSFRTESAGPNPTREALDEIRQETIELRDGSRGISELREQFSQPLYVLMGMVGLVLLIACANIA